LSEEALKGTIRLVSLAYQRTRNGYCANDNDEHPLGRDQICSSLVLMIQRITFNDTMIALQLMRTQFPKLEKLVVQPFVLQSQLYSSVKDR